MSAATAILPNRNLRRISSITSKRHAQLYRMSFNEGSFLSLLANALNTMRVLVVSLSDFITA